MKNKKENANYYTTASLAVKLEQTKQYTEAGKTWRKAAQLASTTLNNHWCEARYHLCIKYNSDWM